MKLFHYIVFVLLVVFISQGESAEEKPRKLPKIETKDGSLVLKAGEDGDIVFEPDEGHQVRIGSLVLTGNSSSSPAQGPKGEKGDSGLKGDMGDGGEKGTKGSQGLNGAPGHDGRQGTSGLHGMNGIKGEFGAKGVKGSAGHLGPPGPPGPKTDLDNSTKNHNCSESKDFGKMKYSNYNVQVCTQTGWKSLMFKEDICDNSSVPRIELETFKKSNFGVVFQFNDNLKVNLSPASAASKVKLTTVYQDPASNDTTPTYLPSAMGKAIYLQGRKHINLDGIPANFWSGNEWSVMALVKFINVGLSVNKDLAVIGAGEQSHNKGLHLGFRNQHVLHGFYSNDMNGVVRLNYDQWYQITWTWKNTTPKGTRQIFVNGVLDTKKVGVISFAGSSNNTEIGAWWETTTRNNNIQIDTLYIIDKVIDYKSRWTTSDWLELCQAQFVSDDMP